MGKYQPIQNMNDEIIQDKKQILIWIANELAEGNRLKRLKLKYLFEDKPRRIIDNKSPLIDELEDQA